MTDFVVLGDVMIDHFLQIPHPDIVESIDAENHTVKFPFPSKLHLTNPPVITGGGNAFTVAAAIAKLGHYHKTLLCDW